MSKEVAAQPKKIPTTKKANAEAKKEAPKRTWVTVLAENRRRKDPLNYAMPKAEEQKKK